MARRSWRTAASIERATLSWLQCTFTWMARNGARPHLLLRPSLQPKCSDQRQWAYCCKIGSWRFSLNWRWPLGGSPAAILLMSLFVLAVLSTSSHLVCDKNDSNWTYSGCNSVLIVDVFTRLTALFYAFMPSRVFLKNLEVAKLGWLQNFKRFPSDISEAFCKAKTEEAE